MAMGGHDSFWGNGFLAHLAVIQRSDSVLLLPGGHLILLQVDLAKETKLAGWG